MDYEQIISAINNYVADNFDFLEMIYLRDTDLKYSELVKKVNGNNLLENKEEISGFYKLRGMKDVQATELLKYFDNYKTRIMAIDKNSPIVIYQSCYNHGMEQRSRKHPGFRFPRSGRTLPPCCTGTPRSFRKTTRGPT
jgi:hypothetical protein